jgi:hypothetical protein
MMMMMMMMMMGLSKILSMSNTTATKGIYKFYYKEVSFPLP